jgi:ankyrin repeat protein
LKFLKFLHNNGAEINVKNSKGQTPILTAALHGHRLIVKYLYHHGTGFQGKTTTFPTKMTQKIREMTAPMQIMQRMREDYPM